MDIADIAVIGSGAAATTTLIELFTKLIDNRLAEKMITIVEKYPEFWKGIPYGSRSSVNSLTITPLSDFLPCDEERSLFLAWFKENRVELTYYYQNTGGLAAEKWLEKNLHLIEKSEWHTIYLPRFIFGIYLQEKMLRLLQIVEDRKLARVTLIQAEAIDISSEGSFHRVELEYLSGEVSLIKAKKLVIAIGSAPVKKNVDTPNGAFVYINDLYEPFLDNNLEKMQNILLTTPDCEKRNVLIIGSNASSIELIYLLNHRPDILKVINKVVTISETGKMPHHISEKRLDEYPCENLDQVKMTNSFSIHTLMEATKKDLQPAVLDEVIIPYVDQVIGYTIKLMQVLDEDSKKMFFGIYGPQLSRMIRRSGPEYKASSENLMIDKKLELFKGKFSNIESNAQGATLNYMDSNNESQIYQTPFKVIINCSGSDNLERSSSRLIYNLVHKNICKVNLSGKGFLVNDKFEAAPNLYIMGPLLGGNINNRIHFWHLESVARLLYLSPFLAEVLLTE